MESEFQKAVAASENDTPCFCSFDAALSGSQVESGQSATVGSEEAVWLDGAARRCASAANRPSWDCPGPGGRGQFVGCKHLLGGKLRVEAW